MPLTSLTTWSPLTEADDLDTLLIREPRWITNSPADQIFDNIDHLESRLALQLLPQVAANITDDGGNTLLHAAIQAPLAGIIPALLRKGVPIDQMNWKSETPLMLATKLGNLHVTRLLLQHEANIEITDVNLNTAIFFAKTKEIVSAFATVSQNEPNWNARNYIGNIPAHQHLYNDWLNSACFIIERMEDVSIRNNARDTLLHACAKGTSPRAIDTLKRKEGGVLLYLNSVNLKQETPLMTAITARNKSAVSFTQLSF